MFRPLSVPLPPLPILAPESLGGAAGFLPAAGLFAGGAGGVGLPLAAEPFALLGGGGGMGRATTGGGGGGGVSSFK